jgi:hypothetical protein
VLAVRLHCFLDAVVDEPGIGRPRGGESDGHADLHEQPVQTPTAVVAQRGLSGGVSRSCSVRQRWVAGWPYRQYPATASGPR